MTAASTPSRPRNQSRIDSSAPGNQSGGDFPPARNQSGINSSGRRLRSRGLAGAAVVAALLAAGASLPTLWAAPVRPRALPPQPRPVSFQDRLLPAPVDGGFRQPGYWVWCGTVAKGDDGRFHHYASRWPHALPFSPHWLTNSEVVHSVSATPEGPYLFAGVALPPRGASFWDGQMTHNPVVRKIGGKYVLYYTGTTYAGERPSPGQPVAEDSAL